MEENSFVHFVATFRALPDGMEPNEVLDIISARRRKEGNPREGSAQYRPTFSPGEIATIVSCYRAAETLPPPTRTQITSLIGLMARNASRADEPVTLGTLRTLEGSSIPSVGPERERLRRTLFSYAQPLLW